MPMLEELPPELIQEIAFSTTLSAADIGALRATSATLHHALCAPYPTSLWHAMGGIHTCFLLRDWVAVSLSARTSPPDQSALTCHAILDLLSPPSPPSPPDLPAILAAVRSLATLLPNDLVFPHIAASNHPTAFPAPLPPLPHPLVITCMASAVHHGAEATLSFLTTHALSPSLCAKAHIQTLWDPIHAALASPSSLSCWEDREDLLLQILDDNGLASVLALSDSLPTTTRLLTALIKANNAPLTSAILLRGSFTPDTLYTALARAVASSSPAIVSSLLDHPACPAHRHDSRILRDAISQSNATIVSLLLAHPSIDPCAMDNMALGIAVCNGSHAIVAALLALPPVASSLSPTDLATLISQSKARNLTLVTNILSSHSSP